MIKAIGTISMLAMVAIAGCKSKPKDTLQKNKGPQKSDAYIVRTMHISKTFDIPGTIVPSEETEIHPEVSGKVTQIFFKEGSHVTAGTLLAKIYDDDLQAQLKKLQVQLAIAEKTEQRQSDLLKINGVSQQDYDLSLLNVNNIKADIDILKTSIEKTKIKAPYSGKLGLRNISPGAYVTPQTIVTTLREVNQLNLVFSIPEKYSEKIKEGAIVNFTVEGNDHTYSAKIFASENNISEDTRSLTMKARIAGSGTDVVSGAFAKVNVGLDRNASSLMIPSQAIIPQARNKKVIVLKDGEATMATVTTGWRDSSMVEIVDGLSIGDTVITTGLMAIKPKSKVLINKIMNP